MKKDLKIFKKIIKRVGNEEVLKKIFGGIENKDGEINLVKAKTCGIYDCLNNMVVDFQLTPYKTSEKELTIKNIKNAMKFFKNQKTLS